MKMICGCSICRVIQKIPHLFGKVKRVRKECEIFAYSATDCKEMWRVTGKLPGMDKELCAGSIACDDYGHTFVNDTNNSCIQVFLTDGGIYLGPVLKEDGLGNVKFIRWSVGSCCLVVVHKRDNESSHCVTMFDVMRS